MDNLFFETTKQMGLATYSLSKEHRFELNHQWGEDRNNTLVWIGLRAFEEDVEHDNRRIKRITTLTKKFNYDGFTLINLYSHLLNDSANSKLTDAKVLEMERRNILMASELLTARGKFVCCWGDISKMAIDTDWLKPHSDQAYCLGLTHNAYPLDVFSIEGDCDLQKFEV